MNRLASAIRVPANRINAIVAGQRSITGETALRLARYFGTTPEYWLNMQTRYDLETARDEWGGEDRGGSTAAKCRMKAAWSPHEGTHADYATTGD